MTLAPLWTGLALVAPLAARVSGRPPAAVGGVSIDTRTLGVNDLFVAIQGDHSDGHDYVRAAFEKGAAAVVVDEAHARAFAGLGPLYIVNDTLRALEGLARAARARARGRIVAVTGSVGKTSTKEALRLALSHSGPTHASPASFNNHWGVPLTLARLPADARFGVFEIGMNHAREITPLTDMVRPHVAVVTKIAPVHLEHFASLDAIADAKAEIFSGVVKGGAIVLPRDDAQFDRLAGQAKESAARFVLTFGAHADADARLIGVQAEGEGSRVEAIVLGQSLVYRLGAPGAHHAVNSLALLLAARALGADLMTAADALIEFTPPAGRGRRETLPLGDGTITVIDESYNANPESMRAALDLLGATTGGRRIAVLGDMLELGPRSADLHAALVDDLTRNGVDLLFTAGPSMAALHAVAPSALCAAHGAAAEEIAPAVCAALRPGDIVMIKGSNGSRMVQVVAAVREHARRSSSSPPSHPASETAPSSAPGPV